MNSGQFAVGSAKPEGSGRRKLPDSNEIDWRTPRETFASVGYNPLLEAAKLARRAKLSRQDHERFYRHMALVPYVYGKEMQEAASDGATFQVILMRAGQEEEMPEPKQLAQAVEISLDRS